MQDNLFFNIKMEKENKAFVFISEMPQTYINVIKKGLSLEWILIAE